MSRERRVDGEREDLGALGALMRGLTVRVSADVFAVAPPLSEQTLLPIGGDPLQPRAPYIPGIRAQQGVALIAAHSAQLGGTSAVPGTLAASPAAIGSGASAPGAAAAVGESAAPAIQTTTALEIAGAAYRAIRSTNRNYEQFVDALTDSSSRDVLAQALVDGGQDFALAIANLADLATLLSNLFYDEQANRLVTLLFDIGPDVFAQALRAEETFVSVIANLVGIAHRLTVAQLEQLVTSLLAALPGRLVPALIAGRGRSMLAIANLADLASFIPEAQQAQLLAHLLGITQDVFVQVLRARRGDSDLEIARLRNIAAYTKSPAMDLIARRAQMAADNLAGNTTPPGSNCTSSAPFFPGTGSHVSGSAHGAPPPPPPGGGAAAHGLSTSITSQAKIATQQSTSETSSASGFISDLQTQIDDLKQQSAESPVVAQRLKLLIELLERECAALKFATTIELQRANINETNVSELSAQPAIQHTDHPILN